MDSFGLHTDLYQINMAYTYFRDNLANKQAVFEVYFRSIPFGNGYAIFAGLERVVEYLTNFGFSEKDLAFLKEKKYDQDFLDYLKDLKFTGDLYSVPEGEVVFEKEPLMIIKADLIQAQLIETALLNIVNFQTLIATKASRIKNLAPHHDLFEFGARRAQEMDAAIWGARAAYLSGFDGTSLVIAGEKFGIPIVGTHSHSFVQTYPDEITAFKKYALTHNDAVFLVDTYNTLKQGVPNAIKVADELQLKDKFKGIRIDSGDLAYHSNEARKLLDAAGYHNVKIIVSNDLDEDTIASLLLEKAKIDSFGIGTKLITAYSQPALGAVYKMVAIEDDEKKLRDVIKLSSNVEKITNPGFKQVYRIINKESLKAEADIIAGVDEKIEINQPLVMANEAYPSGNKEVNNFILKELYLPIFKQGTLIYDLPTIEEIRVYNQKALNYLWDEQKRYRFPAKYFVNTTVEYLNRKNALINKIKDK